VELPFWSKNNPIIFIRKHRELLESKEVSDNLHRWIDIIFGYQQRGEEATKAFNLYRPLTWKFF
jgi:hypothetical protein